MKIRPADVNDIANLVALEESCFHSDKISARSFRRFLKQPQDILLAAEVQDRSLLAYGLLLCRRGTSLARLYSLAVSPAARGQGIARAMLCALEQAAQAADCRFIRLEVRTNNHAAVKLYESVGYRRIKHLSAYYEDGQDGLQMEKRLSIAYPHPPNLPFYAQTTPFTCGAAALMMAMVAQNRAHADLTVSPHSAAHAPLPLTRETEIQLWREATTIYMTTGLGGTSPFGLAVAAAKRGFEVEVVASHLEVPFLDSVRSTHKQEVMTLEHQQFIQACHTASVTLSTRELHGDDFSTLISKGWGVLLLISTWRLNRNKAPHWVWLVDIDEQYAYLNDPDVDLDQHQNVMDNQFMPVKLTDLVAMMRYGKTRYRAALLLRRRPITLVKPPLVGR